MDSATPPKKKLTWQRILLAGKRLLKYAFLATLIYLAILLVGLIPVNRDFVESEDGITIYIVSNAIHADLILPKTNQTFDWTSEIAPTACLGDVSNATHVAIGWGDKGFFLETPTWEDLKISTAANALFVPSTSCVHVAFAGPENFPNAASVTVSEDQYLRLVEFIQRSFQRDTAGSIVLIPNRSYSWNDAFFAATGNYHLFNTCNSWAGRGLKVAGVKAPWFSPLPKTPMLYLPDEVE